MRETHFVEQNKEKWKNFETQLRASKVNPELLREQFIQVTDDLSYSRTFYKNRSVRVYLNGLAQKVYSHIYKNKRDTWKSIKRFFTEDVPYISYQSRKIYLLAFILLLVSVSIGIISSAKDEQFAASILGQGYVEMSAENIKKGDPMAVYKSENAFEMFFGIATNNLKVSLLFFLCGLVLSYGSIVLLFFNGIMLGTFMYFFYSRGVVTEFNYTVWMHGTIEIVSMIFECAAGVMLGRGLVFTGTFSRFKSFSIWAKRGSMLFLSLVPFVIFAAFIESFLTRYTEASNVFRGIVIFGSLALMVTYFVIYPWRKYRGKDLKDLGPADLRPEKKLTHEWDQIHSNGSIFLKTIQVIGQRLSLIMKSILLLCGVLLLLYYFLSYDTTIKKFELLQTDILSMIFMLIKELDTLFRMYGNVALFFNPEETFMSYVILVFWQSLVFVFAAWLLRPLMKDTKVAANFYLQGLFSGMVVFGVYNLLLFSNNGGVTFLYILFAPFAVIWAAASVFHTNGPFSGFSYMWKLVSSGFIRLYGSYLIYLLLSFMIFIFIISPFTWLMVFVLQFNVQMSDEAYTRLLQYIMSAAFIFVLTFTYIFYFINTVLLSFSVTEVASAQSLIDKIDTVGTTRKAYGLETE